VGQHGTLQRLGHIKTLKVCRSIDETSINLSQRGRPKPVLGINLRGSKTCLVQLGT
jgi:hypothetical protein